VCRKPRPRAAASVPHTWGIAGGQACRSERSRATTPGPPSPSQLPAAAEARVQAARAADAGREGEADESA
jgi:hypothetical protein